MPKAFTTVHAVINPKGQKPMNASQYVSTEIHAAVAELLHDDNTTPHKFPAKLRRLFAAANVDRAPPESKLTVAEVDDALRGRNMSITERMELKHALHAASLI